MLLIDIIYIAILFTVTYFTFFSLLLWMENRGDLKYKSRNSKLPSLSLILPVYNEENVIAHTIKNLLSINYPKDKMEIVVVDDGSTDNTYNILKKFADKIQILRKKNEGKASALNFGLKHVKNEYVAVMDADTILDSNALANCMKCFDSENIAAVTSHIISKSTNTLLEKMQNIEYMVTALIRKVKEKPNLIDATPGPLSIYKKNILVKLGGFDEKNVLEDVEIAWRLLKNGYKIKMAYDAMAYTTYPKSLKSWWKQRTRWGVGGLQTLTKYFDCITKKNTCAVGTFLVPINLLSYVSLLLALMLFSYRTFTFLARNFFYISKALSIGMVPIPTEITFYVDIFLIYTIIAAILTIASIKISMDNHGKKLKLTELALYLITYTIFFSLNSIYSLYKFVRKDFRWFTK